jgi:serine/threonine protein kinase
MCWSLRAPNGPTASMVMHYDPVMSLPKGWKIVPGEQPSETGQSWVYKVRKAGHKGTFALKLLKNADNRRRRERFAREVLTMIRLEAQGVALPPIVEYDLERERPYFVMPWYAEGSLDSRVVNRSYVRAPTDALQLLVTIAVELQKLHTAGVAHRDLKPANILLSDEGPLLADFGLCIPIDDEADRLTATAEAIGSRFYIAPENESGMNDSVDQRPGDFYAFAKITWALLSGRTPPARELIGTPERRLAMVLADPRFATLDSLLDELLNTDPRARLDDWGEVIEELEAFQGLLKGVERSSKPGDLRETRRLAQRLGQLPSVQAYSQRRTSDERMQEWANSQLVTPLASNARGMQDDLTTLTSATNGAVDFNVSTGGIDLKTLAGLEPRLSFPEYDAEMVSLGGSGAFILFTIQPITELKIPALHLALFLLQRHGEFWILRAPVLPHSPGGLPEAAIHRYHGILGPVPMMRPASINRALKFCQETMELFQDMAHRYVSTVANGWNLRDERTWLDL